MKNVAYTAYQLLSCAPCNGDVIICLDASLVATDMPFMEASIASTLESYDSCGKLQYTYGFTYDENLLANPNYDLVATDIKGVFCQGCLTSYISAVGTPSIQYIESLFQPFFDHLCMVSTEAELIAAIASVDCNQILIVSAFSLTANRTIPVGKALTYFNGCKTSTNGHVFTINGAFNAGIFQCFSTTVGKVVFGTGATEKVYPQWFGAVGDGTTDDSLAFNVALGAATILGWTGVLYAAVSKLEIPSGNYSIQSSLNATKTMGLVIEGSGVTGTRLTFNTTGQIGIDFTGARQSIIRDIEFNAGAGGTACNITVLYARDNSGINAGWHKMINVVLASPTTGTTHLVGIYSYASEQNEFYNSLVLMSNPQSTGFWITNKNDLGIASPFVTIAVGEQSNTVMNFYGGELRDGSTNVGANSIIPLHIHNARNVTLFGVSISGNGNELIYLESDGPSTIIDELCIIGCRVEGGPNGPINFMHGPATNLSVIIGEIVGNIFNASNAVYQQDGAGSAIQLGSIRDNNFNGTLPTYMIKTAGSIYGGYIDVGFGTKLKVQCLNCWGGVYYNLDQLTDFVATHAPPATFNTLLVTDGTTEQKRKFDGDIALRDLSINSGVSIVRHTSVATTWSPNTADGTYEETPAIIVASARPGDTVTVGFEVGGLNTTAGVLLVGKVSGPGFVIVTAFNKSGAPWAPGNGNLYIDIWGHLQP